MGHTETPFLIIGAGPTGIGAAKRLDQLGIDYLIVDAGEQVGGMAASETDSDGFTWDMGGHVLHSHFADFDEAIAEANVEMTSPVRNGWNLVQGQLIPTPIQQQLTELPDDLNPDADAANLAEFYTHKFGSQLANSFFIPFQEKMWATDCKMIEHEWTSLRNGSRARNVPAIKLHDGGEIGVREHFPYPRGGTGALWARIAATLRQPVTLGEQVVDINLDAHIAMTFLGETIHYEHLISTMPLPYLVQYADLPFDVKGLRANEVYCIGMGFQGAPPPNLADKSWIYCPDRNVPWQRATMLSNYDPDNAPGGWNILFECGASPDFRPMDMTDAAIGCATSLTQHFGVDMSELVTTWTKHVPLGYPVPTLGRDDLITKIDARLTAYNVRSRGRFGGWRYESCNQDYSFQQGIEAVNAELYGEPEPAYWTPEVFS